jgi:hypothetical protein
VHDAGGCKINFFRAPFAVANVSARTTVEFEYATTALWQAVSGEQSREGRNHYAWIFGALTPGLDWLCHWGAAQTGRKSAGVSRLTAARRFDFMGFTSIFRTLSLSPRRKRAAAPD